MVFHGGIPLGEEQDVAEVLRKYFYQLIIVTMINVQIKKRTK